KNFGTLRESLEATVGNVVTVILERATLAEQIALFSLADVVIAQHGAALANVVWCRSGARVIEIAPQAYRSKIFPSLSKIVGVDNSHAQQGGIHGDCHIPGLISDVLRESRASSCP